MEVRGLSFADLIAFDNCVVDRQRDMFNELVAVVGKSKGIPDHWAVFRSGDKPVFAVGLAKMDATTYDSFTLFSKHCKHSHLPFIVKFVKSYMKALDYKRIIHAVETDDVAMNKFIKLLGFQECDKASGKTIYHKVKLWV